MYLFLVGANSPIGGHSLSLANSQHWLRYLICICSCSLIFFCKFTIFFSLQAGEVDCLESIDEFGFLWLFVTGGSLGRFRAILVFAFLRFYIYIYISIYGLPLASSHYTSPLCVFELPDKRSRSKADWWWFGARESVLAPYVWTVERCERLGDVSLTPPQVSVMLNIWNSQWESKTGTEGKPGGRVS